MAARFTEEISFEKFIKEGAEIEVQLEDPNTTLNDSDDEEVNVEEELLKFSNLSCLEDDDQRDDQEPFDKLAAGMENLTEDGDVKKKIIREGYGNKPADKSVVRIDYNAYVEYEAMPFDSTYCQKRRREFIVNNSEVLYGLDIAVQSMKVNEKSQFLVSPKYAYGALGCLGRVPQNATILFEVELHEWVDTGAALTYDKLPKEEQETFARIYSYCLSLCVRANDFFGRNKEAALKEYYKAVSKLERVELKDMSEQERQQELLLRLYSNILICHAILGQAKRGCTAANNINRIIRGTNKKLKAKIYFSHAKCLRLLGDFKAAENKLKTALRIERHNPEIANEFLQLKRDIEEHTERQKKMAVALIG